MAIVKEYPHGTQVAFEGGKYHIVGEPLDEFNSFETFEQVDRFASTVEDEKLVAKFSKEALEDALAGRKIDRVGQLLIVKTPRGRYAVLEDGKPIEVYDRSVGTYLPTVPTLTQARKLAGA